MMSEDEIMQGINTTIAFMKEELKAEHSCFTIKELWALNGLLDLYQKEKEKNKKFFNGEIFTRKQIEIVQKAIKKGIEEQLPKEMENFISKDKIRELLEKYDKNIAWANSDDHYYFTKFIKELLEENNEKQM